MAELEDGEVTKAWGRRSFDPQVLKLSQGVKMIIYQCSCLLNMLAYIYYYSLSELLDHRVESTLKIGKLFLHLKDEEANIF